MGVFMVAESTQELNLRLSSGTENPSHVPSFLAEALFQHASEGFVLLDAHRQILWMNPAAVELTGFTQGCGVHCGTLFHCHSDSANPLGNEGCFGNHALLTRKPVNAELNIITKTGQTVSAAVEYSYIPAEDGQEYLLMSIRNISDRKRLEKERRQREALHYTLQERERLARDLHDGVVQDIAYANMQMKMLLEDATPAQQPDLSVLARLSQVLDESYVELRQALYDLTFRLKEDLPSYIRNYLQEYETRTGLKSHFTILGQPLAVDVEISSQVAKVLQEALTNIRKHARAESIQVFLAYHPQGQSLQLKVRDDGQGFDPEQQSLAGHYGLRSMQARCELLGGSLVIDSSIGAGTTVYVDVPLLAST